MVRPSFSLRSIMNRHGHSLVRRRKETLKSLLLIPTIATLNMDGLRTFGNHSKGGGSSSDKNKIMKRQLQRNPAPSPPTTTQQQQQKSPSTSNFNIISNSNENLHEPIFSNAPFSRPTLGTPIQAMPTLTWETDKMKMLSTLSSSSSLSSSSLSSLPDDAASLMDKEELFDPSIHLPYAPKDWTGYEPSTPLTDFLMSRIGVSGRAITTAEYMRHALTHPSFGYYTNPPSLQEKMSGGIDNDFETNEWEEEEGDDTISTTSSSTNPPPHHHRTNDSTLIGPRGDFVTAPEVSHVFGQCLCVWFVTQWQSPLLNKPSKIQLVELGPGRGTLIADILQLATASTLQEFGKSIVTVNLIEASRALRKEQEMSLKERLGHLIDFDFVHVSPFRTMPTTSTTATSTITKDAKKDEGTTSADDTPQTPKIPMRIEWHDSFSSFSYHRDRNIPVFVIAQEFLDALPVHSFQKTSEGWRERLIDVASIEDDEEEDNHDNPKPPPSGGTLRPRLRQVLAPDVTPAVQLLIAPNQEQYRDAPLNSVIEICPEAIILVQDIAKVLEESQGVALLIDYGQDGTADTLRAFSNHRQVPLTSQPGQVDVTADVDFFALRQAVRRPPTTGSVSHSQSQSQQSPQRQIHAFGPVRQGEFLMRMGIADMVVHSIEQETTSPEYAQALSEALKYLVLPEYMGDKFKVLALAPKREGIFAPAGME